MLDSVLTLSPSQQCDLFERAYSHRLLVPWLIEVAQIANDAMGITTELRTAPSRFVFPPASPHETVRLACWAATLPAEFRALQDVILRTCLDRGCECLTIH